VQKRFIKLVPEPRRQWLHFTDAEMATFVSTLASQAKERQHVKLGCPAADENICVLAAPFLNAFKRGHFIVDNDQIFRVVLGKPESGIVISAYGHADKFDPQDPDQGKWVQQTPSLSTVEDAFAAIGVNTGASADETLPESVISVYFGIEPNAQTNEERKARRIRRQDAEREIERLQLQPSP